LGPAGCLLRGLSHRSLHLPACSTKLGPCTCLCHEGCATSNGVWGGLALGCCFCSPPSLAPRRSVGGTTRRYNYKQAGAWVGAPSPPALRLETWGHPPHHHIEIEDTGTDVYLALLTMGLWALCFGSESFRTHVDVCM
jgi:hypothetical protein